MQAGVYVRRLACLAFGVIPWTIPAAEAQVIIGRGGGIGISVPGVGVRVGVPGVYVRPYGVARRAVVAPYGSLPGYGAPYGTRYNSRFDGSPSAPPSSNQALTQQLPTAGELRAMTDDQLLNALAGLTAQLDADLNRFDTADTWQRYLRLPDDALPPPTNGRVNLGLKSLQDSLTRFDRTVARAEFVQITGLPSFAATHAALGEVVRRYGDPSAAPASAAPVARRVPPPVPTPPEATSNERQGRGILLRNRHARRNGGTTAADAPPAAQPSAAAAEELPTPPPALAAPQTAVDDATSERSILSK